MEKWRSIDYEKLLQNGISIERVQREMKSLRLLCERYDIHLGNLNEDSSTRS
ncbi:hypothetical protein Arcve_0763 [Archaeoglobus veneficus SNP6]|uniref:Uncharacterized protein n=1 Tax=Archaeoglobus veneficus (strain DSM 11195 / SNP6) TaxID=693661 RepID=F2KRL4_ARCVS|nr:hypothetical protein Arcve_0763 [Archaeoglobus veneficus SNP6]